MTTASVTFLSSNCLSFSSFAFLRFPEVLFVNKLYPKGAERQTPNARIVQVFHLCSQRVCFRLSSFTC